MMMEIKSNNTECLKEEKDNFEETAVTSQDEESEEDSLNSENIEESSFEEIKKIVD